MLGWIEQAVGRAGTVSIVSADIIDLDFDWAFQNSERYVILLKESLTRRTLIWVDWISR